HLCPPFRKPVVHVSIPDSYRVGRVDPRNIQMDPTAPALANKRHEHYKFAVRGCPAHGSPRPQTHALGVFAEDEDHRVNSRSVEPVLNQLDFRGQESRGFVPTPRARHDAAAESRLDDEGRADSRGIDRGTEEPTSVAQDIHGHWT